MTGVAALSSPMVSSLEARFPVTVGTGTASATGGQASFRDTLLAARARESAEQIVASSLVQPILASIREQSRAEGPFAPSTAEKRFGPMLDQHLADRIVRKANFPLVDRLERHLTEASVRRPALNLEGYRDEAAS